MKRLEATIFGRVQGVGFRDAARLAAQDRRLVGEVWNNDDGSVGLILEGPAEVINEFLQWSWYVGPGKVGRYDERWLEATGAYKDFATRNWRA